MDGIETFATLPMWAGFIGFVLVILALDLFVLGGKRAHRVSSREAFAWVVTWFMLATFFGLLQWWFVDGTAGRLEAHRKTLEFFTGYLLELSLSVDNMFVFSMIFGYFTVPPEFQRRILLFGVLGAIVMRICMIIAGVWLLSKFIWLFYVFGLFLLLTGTRMLFGAEHEHNLDRNPVVRLMRKFMRMTPDYSGEAFFVRSNGLLYATPMFAVLLMVETTDLVFAVDSIPAIFAVTTDPFIVFTSNIFAIMGLRAMYFLLANMAERFHYLKYGLAIILIVIGGKMMAAPWVHIPVQWSLGVVGIVLLVSIGASLTLSRQGTARDAGNISRVSGPKGTESKRRP